MSDFKGYWKNYEDENYVLGSEEYCAEQAWNHQQAIIDNLKAQLNNMEACYIEKKKQVEELHGKAQKALQEVSGASRFVNKDSAKDFDFLQGAVLRSYSRIEEALRGGHDSLTDARQKAEDQINNGARLTKHQIDL